MAALAISGECDGELDDALGQIDLLDDGLGASAELGVARAALTTRSRSRAGVKVDLADDLARRRLAVAGRADGRRAAARASPPVIDAFERGLLRALAATSMVPHLVVFRPGSESLMIGLAVLPSAMMTRSTCIISVWPVATGLRRPDASGAPSSMTSSRSRRDEVRLSSPMNSRGARSTLSCDALLERVVQLLDAGRHLGLGAAVDDGDVAAEPPGRARRVHGGVAAADDDDVLAVGTPAAASRNRPSPLHEVDAGEELVGRHHVEQVLARHVHEARQAGAGADEDLPEAGRLEVARASRSCRRRSS